MDTRKHLTALEDDEDECPLRSSRKCARRRARHRAFLIGLGACLGSLTIAVGAQSQTASAARASKASDTLVARDLDRDAHVKLPFLLHAYSRQVQVGTLDWVVHPALALGAEYPSWRAGRFSFFPSWRLGFEHHSHLHSRWYLGVAPSVRIDVHPRVSLQLSLGVSGAHLISLWTPYRFNDSDGTWSKGESEAKWTWLFDLDAIAWLNFSERLGLGLGYGVGALYPFALANELPIIPLTRLGLSARWVYGA